VQRALYIAASPTLGQVLLYGRLGSDDWVSVLTTTLRLGLMIFTQSVTMRGIEEALGLAFAHQ
jgi:hypothetical protein